MRRNGDWGASQRRCGGRGAEEVVGRRDDWGLGKASLRRQKDEDEMRLDFRFRFI